MKKILIIDTSAVMYRSHFAMQTLTNSKGQYTGACYGFVRLLDQAINEVKPDYILCAKDVRRSELARTCEYSEYKSERKPMPTELASQLEYIDRIISAYNINSMSVDTHEADDVIGTLSTLAVKQGIETHIYTGDKDIQQLIRNDKMIIIHVLGKNILIDDYEKVKEYIDVYPTQIPDLFGLKGDKSDGIPGVMGVGQAYASKLINSYGNLENIYENIDKISLKLREKLLKDKNMAYISRKLATIKTDIFEDFDFKSLEYKNKDSYKLKKIYEELELNSFIKKLDIKENDKLIDAIYIDNIKAKDILENLDMLSLYEDGLNIYIADSNKIYYTETFDLSKIDTKANLTLYDAKKYMHLGLKLRDNFFDILIAAYVIYTESNLDIEDIALKYLDMSIEKYSASKFKKLEASEIVKRGVKIVKAISLLRDILEEKIQNENTYFDIEKPIIKILYAMEKKGIKISRERFLKYRKELSKKIEECENTIYDLAGYTFNIDSTRSIANLLFEKMQLKAEKKTKNGYSTDAFVLENLSKQGIVIADYILKYREYRKLLSTYVEAIPSFADNNDRVHSVFNGVGTVTGRLSSLNPNLQNIPARNDSKNAIRSCFIAEKGYKLVSFDYSQIELRVLAELSQDKALIKAYKEDLDLHEQTAREIFNKHMLIESITKSERNLAKIIKFSVLYGKTAYGLAEELKIDILEAKRYIEAYFNKYKSVKQYIDDILKDATDKGYVKTLYGTKRYIQGLNSKNKIVYNQAKRMAVNTVIQGTAANILKLVMIELHKKGYEMLVQVHDELIFEIKEDIVHKEVLKIKEIMENTIKLKNVKLKVNYSIGDNWGDLK